MHTAPFQIRADDDHAIHGTRWLPDGHARAYIQLFHGLGEHHKRYARFAEAATAHGIALVAHDHRGHGKHCSELGWFAQHGGWRKLIGDGEQVHCMLRDEFGDMPRCLLGHSMGSYIAQAYVMQYPENLQALVLSASTWASILQAKAGNGLARFESWRLGEHARSKILHKLGFGDFNKPFEPGRTPLDWLSRDPQEVDKYIDDPLCDGPYTCALWKDLTGGLVAVTSDSALAKIPSDLPILLTGGSDDPVGGESGITQLARHYESTGHSDVTVRIYAGGRHEMFNEINRDEFSRELIDWIANRLPAVTGG